MIVWKLEVKGQRLDVKIFFQSYHSAVDARVFQVRRELLQSKSHFRQNKTGMSTDPMELSHLITRVLLQTITS